MHSRCIGWDSLLAAILFAAQGLGEITDELPRFGPLTFPMATADRTLRCAADRPSRCLIYNVLITTNKSFAEMISARIC